MQLHQRATGTVLAAVQLYSAASTSSASIPAAAVTVDLQRCCERQVVGNRVQERHCAELRAQLQHLLADQWAYDCGGLFCCNRLLIQGCCAACKNPAMESASRTTAEAVSGWMSRPHSMQLEQSNHASNSHGYKRGDKPASAALDRGQ